MISDLMLHSRIWFAAVRIELRAATQYRANLAIQVATTLLNC